MKILTLTAKEKLKKIRQVLETRGLGGILVPRADPHYGEFIAPFFDDLGWVTSFTGSAGTALILASNAALFVDGRYTLQAQKEMDPDLFEVHPLSWSSMGKWIETFLPQGETLGVYTWVIQKKFFDFLQKTCQKGGGDLQGLSLNPLEALRADRPPLPRGAMTSHPLRYAGRTSADKRRHLQEEMQKAQADVLVLNRLDSIAWLLNIRGKDIPYSPVVLAFCLVFQSGDVDLFVLNQEAAQTLFSSSKRRITVKPYHAFSDQLRHLGNKTVWIDPVSTPVAILNDLKAGGASLYESPDPCLLPKALKNDQERKGARETHIKDGVALVHFLEWLENEVPKRTVTEEKAAAYLLECRRHQEGFQELSFPTISAVGENSALVHYTPPAERSALLSPGDIYLLDSGGHYLEGTTDVTRTLSLGRISSQEQRRLFTRVLKGHIALAQIHFPQGTSGHQLDCLARQFLWEQGFDFNHGTGHGVGNYLNVHEGPQSISYHPNATPLEPGMIVSNEPGYYKEGAYGIRIESLMVVEPSSITREKPFYYFDVLTLVPIDVSLLEEPLLTHSEKMWLNTYHQKVFQTLSPFLDPQRRRWLRNATKPLESLSLEDSSSPFTQEK